jgi:hypothetical protein
MRRQPEHAYSVDLAITEHYLALAQELH